MKFVRTLNRKYLSLPFWVRVPIVVTFFICFLISIQNPLIFPGAVTSLLNANDRTAESLPVNVSSSFITTPDREKLELWKLSSSNNKPIAVIFHGNGGDVENFFPYQKYFSSIGITSYGVDYRGYGKSTGWPSERGLEIDADAILTHLMAEEQVEAKDLIIVGVSVGSGPASYAAKKYAPACLILFSPFISLPDAIQSRPFIGALHHFSFYQFPVAENVSRLTNTCLIVLHGNKDNVIPFEQGRTVYENAKVPFSKFLTSQEASHNDILYKAHNQLTPLITECINAT